MLKLYFKLVLLVLLLVGCTVAPVQVSETKVKELSKLLHGLDATISKKESLRLSKDIFQKTIALARDFKLTSPPLWHNTLVNIGLRKKGLCYHWEDALYVHLKLGDYIDFEFHFFVADMGTYFEHNALGVTAKGKDVKESIILDGWRDSGRLYFSKIKKDSRYVWSHRFQRGCR
jgi:hypothetical protein